MADHPEMPDPGREMTPKELLGEIEEWAIANGLTYESSEAASEYGKIVVRDPNDGSTYTTIPNAHKGKRLRLDQVRYTVRNLNRNWRD
jgi:hypothetical protein